MPKEERILLQVRVSPAEKRRIKTFAAKQGLPLQKAVVEAFNAWAEKLHSQPHADRPAKAPGPKPSAPPEFPPLSLSLAPDWLRQALRLDWTKCPEVELLDDGQDRLWMLRESDAPLNAVLRAVSDGFPLPEIAEVFDLELSRLAKIVQFAIAANPTRYTDNGQLASRN